MNPNGSSILSSLEKVADFSKLKTAPNYLKYSYMQLINMYLCSSKKALTHK